MKILINTKDGAKMLDTEKIISCKADNKYTRVHIYNFIGKKMQFDSIFKISELENLLPEKTFF